MKNIFAMLLAVALAICLAACAGSAVPANNALDDSPEETDEITASESERLVTGTVVYYDGSMLAICTNNNANLNFLVPDSEVDSSEVRGLLAGSRANVYYTGQINGGNTSAARVTKLSQTAEQAVIDEGMGVIGGIITASDAKTLHMLSFEGEALTFLLASDDIDMEHTGGLPADAYVTVFYEGVTGNAEAVRVIKVVQ